MSFEYWAFISYSHVDERVARRLHARLERIRLPDAAGASEIGIAANKLYPIFRDRTDARSGALGDVVEQALARSAFLIVVSTPSSNASRYVREEVGRFRELHGPDRILLVGAFPQGTRVASWLAEYLGEDPLYADLEKDGFELAALKLAAGVLGCDLTLLADRERARRARTLRTIVSISLVVSVVMTLLAWSAVRSKNLAYDREYRASLTATRSAIQGLDVRGADAFLRAAAQNPLDGWERDVLAAQTDAGLRSFRAHEGRITALTTDRDARSLITLDDQGGLRVFDRASLQLLAATDGAQPTSRVLCTGQDGEVVFAVENGKIGLWDPVSDEQHELDFPPEVDSRGTVVGLVPASPTPDAVTVVTSLGDVFTVDPARRRAEWFVRGLVEEMGTSVQSAQVLQRGRTWDGLLGGSNGHVFDFRGDGSGRVFSAWLDRRSPCMVMTVHLGHDGQLAAFGDSRGMLFLQDRESGSPLGAVRAHHGTIYGIASDSDAQLWTCGRDGSVACWTRSGQLVARFLGHRAIASSLCLVDTAEQQLLYSSDESGVVYEWDRRQLLQPGDDLRHALGFREGRFRGFQTTSIEYVFDGESVVMGCQTDVQAGTRFASLDLGQRRVRDVWDAHEYTRPLCMLGEILVESVPDPELDEHGQPRFAVRHVAPDGSDGWLLRHAPLEGAGVACIEITNGKVALASMDGRAVVWSPDDSEPLEVDLTEITDEDVTPAHVRLSPSGELLAVSPLQIEARRAGRAPFVLLVDLEDREVRSRIDLPARVANLAWDPDSRGLWISTADKALTHVDVDGDPVANQLTGLPEKLVSMLAVHPTESRIVLGMDDGTVAVWNIDDGLHLVDLGVLDAGVYMLAFSNDGTTLTAASTYGDFRYWSRLPTPGSRRGGMFGGGGSGDAVLAGEKRR